MSERGRVAMVSPRADRRTSAGAWASLLRPQADLQLCESPSDQAVAEADFVVMDEECPDVDRWITAASANGRTADSIILFAGAQGSERGAIPWGRDGENVLATISDLLDRRQLLEDSAEFLEELRASNERLDRHRRRFARVVLDQSEALRGANESLAREVERLTRLQGLPRFFAAPGPDDTFDERLAEVLARTLGAAGAAVLHREKKGWRVAGRWKISEKNARSVAPVSGPSHRVVRNRPSTRKGHVGWWVPEAGEHPESGVAVLFREGRDPDQDYGDGTLDSVRELLTEGLAARAASLAAAWRGSQSERMLETLRGGLLKLDANGRVAVVNPALAEIVNRPVEELEGATLESVFPRDPHLLDLFRGVLKTGRSIDDQETYATTAHGRRISVSVRASPVGDAATPEGVLVLISDLSRRKEVEAEVRKVDRLSALGRLSAGVAHEIRNPLAGIRTTAEILRSRVDDRQDLIPFVDVILEETLRLDRIVGSLLDFAKPTEPKRVTLELVPLLEHAGRLAAGRAADRGVTLEVASPERLPAPSGDRDQILQVLLNLLLNAVEATPEGGRVDFHVRHVRTDRGAEIQFVVEDGGEGVPRALRERIFDPFFTTKPGGTGLGLSISQNILRQHGGQLHLERDEDGRSRAVAVLPLEPLPVDSRTGGEPWRTS